MSADWEWVCAKDYGWESILVASDAPYSRQLEAHAHAATRKTSANQYFYRFSSMLNEQGEPKSYSSLAECEQECQNELRIRQVRNKLDRTA